MTTGFAAQSGAVAHLVPTPSADASAGDVDAAVELPEALVVDGDDGHHLERVRRLRVGEVVSVADGRGRWRTYEIGALGRGRLDLRATGPVHDEPRCRPGLAVAFALGKGAKPEAIEQDCTELGVDRIVWFRSARSVVRWDDDRTSAAAARFAKVAREAAMQSRRAWLPEVAGPLDVAALATHPALVVGDVAGASLAGLADPPGGAAEWCAVVGAEGGLDPAERELLLGAPGAQSLAVGVHVLRTETAAVALAAALTTRRLGGPVTGRGDATLRTT